MTGCFKIHEGHLGIQKCKRRPKQAVFWPGFNKDVEKLVKQCKVWNEKLPSKQKEPLTTYEVPDKPWIKVGSEYGGKTYHLITDYYSL